MRSRSMRSSVRRSRVSGPTSRCVSSSSWPSVSDRGSKGDAPGGPPGPGCGSWALYGGGGPGSYGGGGPGSYGGGGVVGAGGGGGAAGVARCMGKEGVLAGRAGVDGEVGAGVTGAVPR